MSVQLDDIAENLLIAAKNLQTEDRSILETTVADGNTLVEGLSHLLRAEAPDLRDLLAVVVDEVFVDLHIAVTLAMARQFKAACVLLRTCIETSLYLVYFADHPLEAKIWANNSQDLTFNDVLVQVASSKYLSAASGRKADDEVVKITKGILQSAYRELSERVHGKYAFLQSTRSEIERSPKSFADVATSSIRALGRLILLRCSDVSALEAAIPALGRITWLIPFPSMPPLII